MVRAIEVAVPGLRRMGDAVVIKVFEKAYGKLVSQTPDRLWFLTHGQEGSPQGQGDRKESENPAHRGCFPARFYRLLSQLVGVHVLVCHGLKCRARIGIIRE